MKKTQTVLDSCCRYFIENDATRIPTTIVGNGIIINYCIHRHIDDVDVDYRRGKIVALNAK